MIKQDDFKELLKEARTLAEELEREAQSIRTDAVRAYYQRAIMNLTRAIWSMEDAARWYALFKIAANNGFESLHVRRGAFTHGIQSG